MNLRPPVTAGAVGLAVLLLTAAPAAAHVGPSQGEAPAGSYLKFELRVPHGCEDDGNTTKVEVQIPEGIFSVTPQVVPGWTITKATEVLTDPIDDGEGGEITERDATVTWQGGPLAHDQLEEFGLSVKLPDTPGETILFPTIQTCDNGASTAWIQVPEEGEEEPDHPAPAITLTESTGDEHGGTTETTETDEEAIDTSPASVTVDDDDGAGGVAIAGLAAGLLGLGLGGTALARTRRSS